MATLLVQFSHLLDAIKRVFATPQPRRDALSILQELDRYRDLPTSVAIAAFFASAGIGVLAFFLINEAALWHGINAQAAFQLVSLAWALIIPVWMLSFLFIMAVLGAAGVRDLRSAVRHGLANLKLGPDRLRELQRTVAARHWRHGSLIKSVIAELRQEQAPC